MKEEMKDLAIWGIIPKFKMIDIIHEVELYGRKEDIHISDQSYRPRFCSSESQ